MQNKASGFLNEAKLTQYSCRNVRLPAAEELVLTSRHFGHLSGSDIHGLEDGRSPLTGHLL